MKKIITSVVLASAVAFSGQALAANSAATSNVAVVNVADILHSSQQVADATQKIKDKFAPQQKKIQDAQAKLQDEMAKFDKDGAVMSDADKKKMEDQITSERQNVVKEIAAFQKSLTDAQTKTMKAIFDQLNGVIGTVAKKDGYNMVIDSQFVVYNDEANNITDEVQKAFSSAK